MAVKKSKKSTKVLKTNSTKKTATSKVKSTAKSKIKRKAEAEAQKKKNLKSSIKKASSKKNVSGNKIKINTKTKDSKSKNLASSKKSIKSKSEKKSKSLEPKVKTSTKKNTIVKSLSSKKEIPKNSTSKTKNIEKNTISDSKSNALNENVKKDDWKTKYGFEETNKAGKESIKEIPAIIIQPKEEQNDEIKDEKIKDITSSVTSPKYTTSFLDAKTDKEPEGKFEMEFMVRCSPDLLFEFLYTPSGLSEWFCDDVNIRNGVYTFNWNGEISQARLLKMVEGERVRYQWANRTDGAYFEFRIVKDELTGDVSLFITDFADPPWDIEGGKRLWRQQIEKLLKLIGSLY